MIVNIWVMMFIVVVVKVTVVPISLVVLVMHGVMKIEVAHSTQTVHRILIVLAVTLLRLIAGHGMIQKWKNDVSLWNVANQIRLRRSHFVGLPVRLVECKIVMLSIWKGFLDSQIATVSVFAQQR